MGSTSDNKRSITLSEVFGTPRNRDDIIKDIQADPVCSGLFSQFSKEDRERILLFLEGSHSLQILEDRFFRHVLRPDIAPERTESLISAIIGEPVSIVQILSREGSQISESGSLVVMDIIVKLATGALVNIEIQRIGFKFPGERSSCYTADMIMRQYNQLRAQRGAGFNYRDMKSIYLLVIMDKSSSEFRAVAPEYIHRRETGYSSNAAVKTLENVIYISLDTYRELSLQLSQSDNPLDNDSADDRTIGTDLDAWLQFFSFEDPEHVLKFVSEYPMFLPMYQEIAEFRRKPTEVMGMFSEALRIMDQNTTKYMIDEMNQELDDLKQAVLEQQQAYSKLTDENSELRNENARLKAELDRIRTP